VIRTYLDPTGIRVAEIPFRPDGTTDPATLGNVSELAAVAVQSPNFFGCIEEVKDFAAKAHGAGALCIAGFSEPLAFGLFKNPGSLGADIACGEGQSLGIPRSFGGPGLGMFASKMQYVRNMPGRLVGETVDLEGRRGFVLTLATREQHIRREKATSNICTNNSLCALTAAAYMACLGGTGLRELAQLNHDKAEYLKAGLRAAGISLPFSAPTFNEFVAAFPAGFRDTHRRLRSQKIVAGLPLEPYYPELPGHYLLCATETLSKADIDTLVREVQS
jgi:glycine dehydrogenase subunit 1